MGGWLVGWGGWADGWVERLLNIQPSSGSQPLNVLSCLVFHHGPPPFPWQKPILEHIRKKREMNKIAESPPPPPYRMKRGGNKKVTQYLTTLHLLLKGFHDIWLLAGEILTALFLFSSFFLSLKFWSKWACKTLKPWIPQVFCHGECLLIQSASMDPFFALYQDQDWKKRDRRHLEKVRRAHKWKEKS